MHIDLPRPALKSGAGQAEPFPKPFYCQISCQLIAIFTDLPLEECWNAVFVTSSQRRGFENIFINPIFTIL
jgi:hypothetical protein